MKKYLLLAIVILQVTLLFGQSTQWGQWQTVKCFKGLQFRTRQMSNNANDFSKYIQFRNNYSQKIAFSFVVKEGSEETDEYIKAYGGQYRTELNANSTDDGLMWVSLKNNNVAYLSVGYLRHLVDGKIDASIPYAGCDDGTNILCHLCTLKPRNFCNNYDGSKENNVDNQPKSTFNSLSVEELEGIILANLKANLKVGSYYNNIDNYNEETDYIVVAGKEATEGLYIDQEPNTLHIRFHSKPRIFSYFLIGKYSELNVTKRTSQGVPLLHFIQELDDEKKRGGVEYNPALFLYTFGPNDENFVELQNAIAALKENSGQTNSNSKQSNVSEKAQNNNFEIKDENKFVNAEKAITNEGARELIAIANGESSNAISNVIKIFASLGYKEIETKPYVHTRMIISFEKGLSIDIDPTKKYFIMVITKDKDYFREKFKIMDSYIDWSSYNGGFAIGPFKIR